MIETVSKVSDRASRSSCEESSRDSLRDVSGLSGAEILVFWRGSPVGLSARLFGSLFEDLNQLFGASTGDRGLGLLTGLTDQGIDEVNDCQMDEAFVLVDLMEDASETGED